MPPPPLRPLGATGLELPPVVFGTSCLGNLYQAVSPATKRAILAAIFRASPGPVLLDTAGKYGAGLALEVMGAGLRELGIEPSAVLVSNKLGWRRVPLTGAEPTFERGVWFDLEHDAVQDISYDGIRRCFAQGRALLGAPYAARLVSVHDPDEYLAAASSPAERAARFADLLGAYRALAELRSEGLVDYVGVGAKDHRVIGEIAREVDLDWVMFALSLTVLRHSPDAVKLAETLRARGVGILNSAVFHSGFLVGGEYFDYRRVARDEPLAAPLFAWRERFVALCAEHAVTPAAACVGFALSAPGVAAVALNAATPAMVEENVGLGSGVVPPELWGALRRAGLIDPDYAYLP